MEERISKWEVYQLSNKDKIIKRDIIKEEDIKYVGGLDISFDKKDENNACAYLTIYDITTNKIVYEDYYLCKMTIPYISGYLGFREIPHYKKLLDRIVDNEFYPQILLVDGSGILHKSEFGSASHLGYVVDIPTIGVAKTLLSHDGLREREIKQKFREKCNRKGDYIELKGDSGALWGLALQSCKIVERPIYITIGHKISLETAKNIVLKSCVYKNPEPIRNSDIKSKLYFN